MNKSAPKVKHLHRFTKVNLSRSDEPYEVYRCNKPLCTSYIRIDMAEGTLCECNRCGEPMLITRATLTGSATRPMTKPHCNNCVKRKKVTNQDVDTISAFLEEVAEKKLGT